MINPVKKKTFFASLDNVYVVYAIDKKQLLNHQLYKSGKMVFYSSYAEKRQPSLVVAMNQHKIFYKNI